MKNKTVLIIEDDSSMLRGLKDNFASKSCQVYTASDGETGLASALKIKPDLIILDIMLPKMNGYEVCFNIREAEMDMPIIMLTAKGQEEDIIRGLNLGADDYVTKPFSIKELLARANAFMRKNNKPVEIFCFGEWSLDTGSRKLLRNEKETILTPKEFALLELFNRRMGYALTRETILNVVWKSSVLTTSRSVDRCVNTLRAKIEPDPNVPVFIHSIRNIGYRFESGKASS